MAQDFPFHGNKAGNSRRNFRDHGPITALAAVPPGQSGQNGHAPARCEGSERPSRRHCALRDLSLHRAQNLPANWAGSQVLYPEKSA
jgi:hypothetical protein